MTRSEVEITRTGEDSENQGHRNRCSKKRAMAGGVLAFLLVAVVVGTLVGVLASQDSSSKGQGNRSTREVDPEFWYDVAKKELNTGLNTKNQMGVAKNVILFIGDGMGPTTVTAGRILAGQMNGGRGEENKLTFDRFPHIGLSRTYNVDTQVTDSAASATAYVSGVKTRQGMLGLSAKALHGNCSSSKGAEVESILKWFADKGRPTGVVTTTRITHATPASTYCHSAHRDWEADVDIPAAQRPDNCKDIASQLVDNNPFINVILGGGWGNFKPNVTGKSTSGSEPSYGRRTDGRDLIQEWLNEKSKDKVKHAYVTTKSELDSVSDNTQHLFGLFSPDHLDYECERDKNAQPSLAEMTSKAIKVLQANTKGDQGFFLMVEGGRIDHGHHVGSAFHAIHEVVSFSKAVGVAVDLTHVQDTLIVVTADHSHTLTIAGYPERGNNILGKASVDPKFLDSFVKDRKPYTTLLYGTGPGPASGARRPNITGVNTNNASYINEAAVPTVMASHGGEDVTIFARGPQSFLYSGVHEQNYIPMLMAYASCVGPFGEGDNPPCARIRVN